MKVLGIIPARGGSKGLPRKNIRPLCGRPLVEYTARAARSARLLSRVILSTDDPEIAEIGTRCGLYVPFIRPPELARDDTPTLPVVQHAVQFLECRGEQFDAICLLQPTNPLRQAAHIDRCIELLSASGADTVLTILPIPHEYNPHWAYVLSENGTLRLFTGESTPKPRRQDLPPVFCREGSIYLTRRDVVMKQHSLYGEKVVGFMMEVAHSVNINNDEDFARAERLLSGTDEPTSARL